jgi:hypothetical protein
VSLRIHGNEAGISREGAAWRHNTPFRASVTDPKIASSKGAVVAWAVTSFSAPAIMPVFGARLFCRRGKNMPDVLVYERVETFSDSLARRGHHIVYRSNTLNHCPGCGRSQWYVGRISAECGFCATAVPLAEARLDGPSPAIEGSLSKIAGRHPEKRRFARMSGNGRELQLLIDGSPASFALHNISAGGAMGETPVELAPGAEVSVRFEGGVLIPAKVSWSDDGMVGLAFTSPSLPDGLPQ